MIDLLGTLILLGILVTVAIAGCWVEATLMPDPAACSRLFCWIASGTPAPSGRGGCQEQDGVEHNFARGWHVGGSIPPRGLPRSDEDRTQTMTDDTDPTDGTDDTDEFADVELTPPPGDELDEDARRALWYLARNVLEDRRLVVGEAFGDVTTAINDGETPPEDELKALRGELEHAHTLVDDCVLFLEGRYE